MALRASQVAIPRTREARRRGSRPWPNIVLILGAFLDGLPELPRPKLDLHQHRPPAVVCAGEDRPISPANLPHGPLHNDLLLHHAASPMQRPHLPSPAISLSGNLAPIPLVGPRSLCTGEQLAHQHSHKLTRLEVEEGVEHNTHTARAAAQMWQLNCFHCLCSSKYTSASTSTRYNKVW